MSQHFRVTWPRWTFFILKPTVGIELRSIWSQHLETLRHEVIGTIASVSQKHKDGVVDGRRLLKGEFAAL